MQARCWIQLLSLSAAVLASNPADAQGGSFGRITAGNWLALGPFSHSIGCSGIDEDLLALHVAPAALHTLTPREGDTIPYDPAIASAHAYHGPLHDGKPVWRSFDDASDDDDLDMNRDAVFVGAPETNVVTFVATYFEFLGAAPAEVELCATSDDGVQVWLDTELVINRNACRGRPLPPGVCQDSAAVTIRPGMHRLLMGIWENNGGWGGSLGILKEGVPITVADEGWRFTARSPEGMSLTAPVFQRSLSHEEASCRTGATGAVAVRIHADFPPGPDVPVVTDRILGTLTPAQVSAPGASVSPITNGPFDPVGEFADQRVVGSNPSCSFEVGGVSHDGGGTPLDPSDDEYVVENIGDDVWIDGDTFTFGYRRVEGDFVLTARVRDRSFVPGSRWGKFGLMARQDLYSRSRYAFVHDCGEAVEDPTRFAGRQTQGFLDNMERTALASGEHLPWLRLERQGGIFIGSGSADPDGTEGTFLELGRMEWDEAPAAVLVGLAASSHTVDCRQDPMAITFDKVGLSGGTDVPLDSEAAGVVVTWSNVSRTALAEGLEYEVDAGPGLLRFDGRAAGEIIFGECAARLAPAAHDFGPIASPDFPHAHGIGFPCPQSRVESPAPGDLLIAGGGQDIWSQDDQFMFAHREVTGDFSARVRVADAQWPAGSRWGRAGIMAREDCARRSHYAFIEFTGELNDGNRLEGRGTSGESDFFDNDPFNQAWPGQRSPVLRLDRCGDTFTGYVLASEDPEEGAFGSPPGDWVEVGSHHWVAAPPAVLLGLAVNSTFGCDPATVLFTEWDLVEGCRGPVRNLSCDETENGLELHWENPPQAPPGMIHLRIDGQEISSLPATSNAAIIPPDALDGSRVQIISVVNGSRIPAKCSFPPGLSEMGFITDWLLLGPFAHTGSYQPGEEAIRLDYLTDGIIDELGIEPRPGDSIVPDYGRAAASRALVPTPLRPELNPGGVPTWIAWKDPDDTVSVDIFPSALSAGTDLNNVMVYAATYIEAEEDLEVELGLASNDSVQVLVNGEEVHINNAIRWENLPNTVQDGVLGVQLRQGTNLILVKLFEGDGNAGFRLRIQRSPVEPLVQGYRVRLPDPRPPRFHRGDANDDGDLHISDGIHVLGYLFLGSEPPPCLEAANADDDGDLGITDGIYILGYLFLGGPAPPPPGPPGAACGPDPESSPTHLGCDGASHCP